MAVARMRSIPTPLTAIGDRQAFGGVEQAVANGNIRHSIQTVCVPQGPKKPAALGAAGLRIWSN